MKPHMKRIGGHWAVWRDRSVSPYSLPTVVRKEFREAFKAHAAYTNFEGMLE